MKHLTDNQITEFWLEGPADKEGYLKFLMHLNECTVCRDRCWDMLLEYRKTTGAITSALDKLAAAFDMSSGAPLALPAGLGNMGPEKAMATMALGLAARRLEEVAEDVTLTSEVIFGHARFDDLEHFASCTECFKRMNLMHDIAQKSLKHPDITSKPTILKNMTRLNAWLAGQIVKIKAIQEGGGGGEEDASGPERKCKMRGFAA